MSILPPQYTANDDSGNAAAAAAPGAASSAYPLLGQPRGAGDERLSLTQLGVAVDCSERRAKARTEVLGPLRPLRNLLFRSILSIAALISLSVLVGIIFLTVFASRAVIDDSRDTLTQQSEQTAVALIRLAGLAFENTLQTGVPGFLLPTAFTFVDATRRRDLCSLPPCLETAFSLDPVPSRADTQNVDFEQRLSPIETDDRFVFNGIPLLINSNYSCVYFSGQSSANVESKWNDFPGVIDKTSYADLWLPGFWRKERLWSSFYMGLDDASSLFRFYPGTLSNREAVQYDHKGRSWYKEAQDLAENVARDADYRPMQGVMRTVQHSKPFRSSSRQVWIMTLSKALYKADACNTVSGFGELECRDAVRQSARLGVAAIDMYIADIRRFITRIDLAGQGEAHLYVTATGRVVASKQWAAERTDTEGKTMTDIEVRRLATTTLTTTTAGPPHFFTQAILDKIALVPNGTEEFEGFMLVHNKIMDDRYTIVLVVALDMIRDPIERQVDSIHSEAWSVFGISCGILIAVFVMEGLLLVWTSRQIIRPLLAVSSSATALSANIGSETALDNGVGSGRRRVNGNAVDPSVSSLTINHWYYAWRRGPDDLVVLVEEYDAMMAAARQMRRDYGRQLHVKNPCHGTPALNDYTYKLSALGTDNVMQSLPISKLERLSPAVGIVIAMKDDGASDEDQSLLEHSTQHGSRGGGRRSTCCNSLLDVLTLRVSIPLVVGCIIVLVVTSAMIRQRADDWTAPIRAKMIADEIATLPTRADAVRDIVASLLAQTITTAQQLGKYTEHVWNFDHSLPSAGMTFQPRNVVYFSPSAAALAPLSEQPPGGIVHAHPRYPTVSTLYSNFNAGLFYMNAKRWNEEGWEYPGARVGGIDKYSQWATEWLPAAKMLQHLDVAARPLYFGNDVLLQILVALEDTEAFWMYPYRDTSNYIEAVDTCHIDGSHKVGYNPTCRAWYQATKRYAGELGKIITHPLTISPSSGLLLLHVSMPLHDANGRFFGVIVVDSSLGKLKLAMDAVSLYKNGYAFLMDELGNVAIHPRVPFAKDAVIRKLIDVEFDATADGCANPVDRAKFDNGVLSNMLARHTGEASVTKCGAKWQFAWRPIDGVEYVLGLAVPISDIEASAVELIDKIEERSVLINVIMAIFVVASGLLTTCVGRNLARKIAQPVADLVAFMKDTRSKDYVTDVPFALEVLCCELGEIRFGMSDLLVALRFAHAGFGGKGRRVEELKNYHAALDIVAANNQERGIGVCLANIGTLFRQWQTESEEAGEQTLYHGVVHQSNAIKFLEEATRRARLAIQATNVTDAARDVLGQRIFNLALCYLYKDEIKLAAYLAEAMEIHSQTGNWLLLAKYAYALADARMTALTSGGEHMLADVGVWPRAFLATTRDRGASVQVDYGIRFAVASLVNLTTRVRGHDQNSSGSSAQQIGDDQQLVLHGISQAAFALGVFRRQPAWFAWMLHHLPIMSAFTLGKAALFLKLSSPDLAETIDSIFSESTSLRWNPSAQTINKAFAVTTNKKSGRAGARSILFCLDKSGSMLGSRIEECRAACSRIVRDLYASTPAPLRNSVRVGLVTFSTDVNIVCELQPVNATLMEGRLNRIVPSGRTAFYDALGASLSVLCNSQDTAAASMPSRWLVALTDGESNSDTTCSQANISRRLQKAGVNLAVITVGRMRNDVITMVKELTQACVTAGMKGLHVEAKDANEIAMAFASVERFMNDTTTGVHEYF